MKPSIFLYGPPGVGKTTIAQILAGSLGLAFVDLDRKIEEQCGKSIPELFAGGEKGFRQVEKAILLETIQGRGKVVALGGGSLLDEESRRAALHAGSVMCLTAPVSELAGRLRSSPAERPLLAGELENRLESLMEQRNDHYASFPIQIKTSGRFADESAWEIQIRLGRFRVGGMGRKYDVVVRAGGLDEIGEQIAERGLAGPVALVSDSNVVPLLGNRVWASIASAGYFGGPVMIPAGESSKTIASTVGLWSRFLEQGLERKSTVVSLGGGVVSDLAGFAAAVYLRGIHWAAVPTTLLAMVDASLGGKTGVDLPQGKNLVGAFHAPGLVWIDSDALQTLPPAELRSGMAEVVKHGVIGDPDLFAACTRVKLDAPLSSAEWEGLVSRAVAVKVRTIQADPFEKGVRAALNLGHTIGHGIEQASHFSLRHGEAVAIGMVLEARLAGRIGLAEDRLADQIREALSGLGLPVRIPPEIPLAGILEAMAYDKKKTGGRLRFALPVRIGEVRTGVEIDRSLVEEVLSARE
ncbi:MAG TPA: 3-dehydroquinate synthase [Anaerolineaceae bacterium]|nr:3-dehydroquinate synthase [Anaerolineaceae bacterium]